MDRDGSDGHRGFWRHYVDELRRLVDPAGPLLVTGVYCFVVIFPCYHPWVFGGDALDPSFTTLERKAREGAWYAAVPVLATGLLLVLTRLLRARAAVFPEHGFRAFGWRVGRRAGWRDAGILYLLMLPLVAFAACRDEFRSTYPLYRLGTVTVLSFALWEAVHLFYMFGWEYLHRGFLLFGLERQMGRWAVLAAAVPFALLHIGKPELEAYGSFIAAVGLGWLALRSRSFLPCVLLHWAVAGTLDLVLVLRGGGSG